MIDLTNVAILETGVRDGLGDRLVGYDRAGGETLQILRVRAELAAFGAAFDEVVGPFAELSDRRLQRMRGVARAVDAALPLVVSEHVEGERLHDLLAHAHARAVVPDVTVALYIATEVLEALKTLEQAAHGALSPGRVILGPDGCLVLAEYMFGPLLEHLEFSHARLWRELRVGHPEEPVPAICDHRADVAQVAIMVVALVLGRPLLDDEYPDHLEGLLNEVREVAWIRGGDPLANALGSWLDIALPMPGRLIFDNAAQARDALLSMLPAKPSYLGSRAELKALIQQIAETEAVASSAESRVAEATEGAAAAVDVDTPPADTAAVAGVTEETVAASSGATGGEAADESLDFVIEEDDSDVDEAEDGIPLIDLTEDVLADLERFGIELPAVPSSRKRRKAGVPKTPPAEERVATAPPAEPAPPSIFDAPEPEPGPLFDEATPEPGPEPVAEVAAPEPEPVAEIVAAEPEPEPEPVAEVAAPEPEPVAEVVAAEPEPEPEPVAEVVAPEPEPEPEPVAEVVAPEPEPVAEVVAPEPEPEPEPVAEIVAPEPEPEPEPVAEIVAPEPEPEPEPVAEIVAPEPEPEPEPVAEVVAPEPEREPEPVAEVAAPEPEAVAEVVAPEPVPEPEPVEAASGKKKSRRRRKRRRRGEAPDVPEVAAPPPVPPREPAIAAQPTPAAEAEPAPVAPAAEWPEFAVPPQGQREAEASPTRLIPDADVSSIRAWMAETEPAPPAAPAPPVAAAPPPAAAAPGPPTPAFPPPASPADSGAEEEPTPANEEALQERVRSYVSAVLKHRPETAESPSDEPIDLPEDAPRSRVTWIRVAAAVVILSGAAIAAGTQWLGARARPGTVVIESTPAEATVIVDGDEAGTTPVTLKLSPGEHAVELQQGGRRQTIEFTVEAGAQMTRRVEWAKVTATGSLEITSDPVGARVLLDGEDVGETPLTLSDLAVGRHTVVLQGPAGSVANTVRIREAQTAKLDVSIYSGWLAVFAPVELQIFERGRLLGTTADSRLMVSPGTHEIELVNDRFQYRATETVEVKPGEVKALSYEPKGTVNLNAVPWAEVFVDGERIGETPLANVQVTIGTREFVFRHPDYGEKRVTATVTLGEVVRVNADMAKQQ